MNIFEKLAQEPGLQFWAAAGIVAVCMALGALIMYIFCVLPLKEQSKERGHVKRNSVVKTETFSYEDVIEELQKDVEFWKGNCKTAEDRYNKLFALYTEEINGSKM